MGYKVLQFKKKKNIHRDCSSSLFIEIIISENEFDLLLDTIIRGINIINVLKKSSGNKYVNNDYDYVLNNILHQLNAFTGWKPKISEINVLILYLHVYELDSFKFILDAAIDRYIEDDNKSATDCLRSIRSKVMHNYFNNLKVINEFIDKYNSQQKYEILKSLRPGLQKI